MGVYTHPDNQSNHKKQDDLNAQMEAVGQHGGDGNNFARNGHALDQMGILHYRIRSRGPRANKEIERHQSTKNEQREVRNSGVLENPREHEGHDGHHDQRVQQRPEYAQGHVAVANPKIFQNQILG